MFGLIIISKQGRKKLLPQPFQGAFFHLMSPSMILVVIILILLQICANVSSKNYHLPFCCRKSVTDYGFTLNLVAEIIFCCCNTAAKSRQFDVATVFLQHSFMLQTTIFLKIYGAA